jgi:DNA-binding SARP family transcriptional activator
MLRLRMLGGLSLARGEEPLTGVATQRRRLAIFALLAVAGAQGVSRDKLLAYLWPETDEERARHVLNQLLYAQRKLFGDEALFTGQKTLRLNPQLISTDLGDFEAALAEGALDRAVQHYQGPFLDGFFMKDAPEFEEWAERHRQRLARRHREALSTLATEAAQAGSHSAASAWYHRAADADPLNGDIMVKLIQSLADAGDRAGAVHAAQAYQARVLKELGMSADPRLSALLKALG